MTPLRTVFMGSDAISLPLLDSIANDHQGVIELIGVFTQPDRPHGRGMKLKQTPIKEWALARGLEVHQPEKVGVEHSEWIREAGVDLLLVMAYGHLLKDDILEAPRLPPLNFHASLLPKLRGASPIETAIATGESRTGISLMRIVRKMDAGPVLDQEAVSIETDDSRAGLYGKLAGACVPLLKRNVQRLLEEDLNFNEQDSDQVTYCRIISKEDGAINFKARAQEIHDRSRAFQPWPGAFFAWEDMSIKVGATAVGDPAPATAAPGQVLGPPTALGLPVATADNIIYLQHLQRPGGRMLPAEEFYRGLPLAIGALLPSQEARPLVARNRRDLKKEA